MQKSFRIDEKSFSRFFSFPSQQLHLLGFTRIADECKIFYHLYDLFAHTWPGMKYPKQKLPAVACESTYTKLRLLSQMNDIKSDGFHKKKESQGRHRREWEWGKIASNKIEHRPKAQNDLIFFFLPFAHDELRHYLRGKWKKFFLFIRITHFWANSFHLVFGMVALSHVFEICALLKRNGILMYSDHGTCCTKLRIGRQSTEYKRK